MDASINQIATKHPNEKLVIGLRFSKFKNTFVVIVLVIAATVLVLNRQVEPIGNVFDGNKFQVFARYPNLDDQKVAPPRLLSHCLHKPGCFGFYTKEQQKNSDFATSVSMSPNFISWNYHFASLKTMPTKYASFIPNITEFEFNSLISLFGTFSSLCKKHDIQTFPIAGTLIGAYRHGGLIPWDEDIDVFMNSSQKLIIKQHLGNLTGFTLYETSMGYWKFYKTKPLYRKIKLNSRHWNWPFIDMYFFSENETHIWDELSKKKDPRNCFEKRMVFPLGSLMFESIKLSAPKCTRWFIEKKYGDVTFCEKKAYSYKHEKGLRIRTKSFPCVELYRYFMFLFHSDKASVLKLDGEVIASWPLSDAVFC